MRLEFAGLRGVFTCAALLFCAGVHAQLMPVDPDWREVEVPAPGPFRTDDLIPIEMPGSTLRFGVSPSSVVIGADGIVRYVVVAQSSSGAVNAMYEGIRCNNADYKVYARYNPGSGWVPAKDTQWQSLQASRGSLHSLTIARTGVCIGNGTNQPASQILRDLGRPVDNRFYQR